MKIETIKKTSMFLGILLCILPGIIICIEVWEVFLYLINGFLSRYSPAAIIFTGMMVLGIILIFFAIYEPPNQE